MSTTVDGHQTRDVLTENHERANDFDYDPDSFVAVHRVECGGNFWIAKVISTTSNESSGKVSVKMFWYQPSGSADTLSARYTAAFVTPPSSRGSMPWVGDVEDKTLMVSFPSLTKMAKEYQWQLEKNKY